MSPHQFTTPTVVYLGSAHTGGSAPGPPASSGTRGQVAGTAPKA